MRKKNKVLWSLWGIMMVGLLVTLIGVLIFNLMWRFAEERKWYERLVTRVELERISLSEDLNQWFDKYGEEYGVNRSLLRRIAYCESSYKPWALSSNRKKRLGQRRLRLGGRGVMLGLGRYVVYVRPWSVYNSLNE